MSDEPVDKKPQTDDERLEAQQMPVSKNTYFSATRADRETGELKKRKREWGGHHVAAL
jgi:hypothetical protein